MEQVIKICTYIFALTKQETIIGRCRSKLHYPDIFLLNLGYFFSSISARNVLYESKDEDNCFVHVHTLFHHDLYLKFDTS